MSFFDFRFFYKFEKFWIFFNFDTYAPSLILPPRFCLSCFKIFYLFVHSCNIEIIGNEVFPNSVDEAFSKPLMDLTDSNIHSCIPKQIPKNGIFVFLATLIAFSLPRLPSLPNPPGMRIPFVLSKILFALL